MTIPAPAPGVAPSETAVVLVNLGTPEAPTAAAVRRYLGEFLSDPFVVQIPKLLWWPLLHGVILPLRSPRVAKKYAEIWLDEGSPLAVHTRRLAAALQPRLPEVAVLHAMRYGEPALGERLRALAGGGVRRVLVLPLYPQYSGTTTGTVAALVADTIGAPEARVVHDYADDPGWVAAVADSIRAHWQAHGRGERLLFSFHGLPQRLVDGGDPYAAHCEASVAGLARALSLAPDDYLLTYQSRFGRERW
ncbi:MAG TPA: ferrochelatase, partial [Luteimonas sp.]|nr:ferrochelatase [Luteimonas sp.]